MPKAAQVRSTDPIKSAAANKAWATRKGKPVQKKPIPKLAPQAKIVLPKEVKLVSTETMMLHTTILVLTINSIGNRRKVDPNSINILDMETNEEVNKDWLGVTRKLMDAPELKKIQGIGSKAKAYVMSRALPSPIKTGVYLLPKAFEEETNEKLKAFVAEMMPHVDGLASHLPVYKKEAKKQQGPQFNEDQFPTAMEIRSAFRLSWRYLYIDSAKGLSKQMEEEERKKTEESWSETRENIKLLLRAQLKAFVDHLVERLEPNEHGEKKSFRESSLDKMMDFLNTLPHRNIVGDEQLKILAEQAKSIITKTDASLLRSDDSVRSYVRHGFETIKSLLDPMMESQPHRRIQIDD